MSCERYSEWMSLYIDKELEKSKGVMFEDHINSCDSCREELDIFQGIMEDIKDLEMIEPPAFFHDDLMKKLQVTSLSVKKSKWHFNLKMVSAVAAVFIFSTMLINPLKINAPKESLSKSEDVIVGARMMMESAPESSVDSQENSDAGLANARSLNEPILEGKSEMWIIETVNYKEYKEFIAKLSEEMGLKALVIEELGSKELSTQNTRIEVSLEGRQKAEFQSKIKDINQTLNIVIQKLNEQEEHNQVKIVILINQLKE